MNVHIIRDFDVSLELYHEVFEQLNQSTGPLKFRSNEDFIDLQDLFTETNILEKDDFHTKGEIPYKYMRKSFKMLKKSLPLFPLKREELSPNELLNSCIDFRQKNDLGDDEFVILLTEKANNLNWFSYGDKNRNVFIHTSEWEFYLDCNRSFPIAYQVVSNILQVLLFKDMTDLREHIHMDESRGCVNDFCLNKKDIRLKMKTADICEDCQSLILERSFPYPIFAQVTNIFEGLRKKLISVERFTSRLGLGRVLFKGRIRKMILLDAGNYEVKLTPLEKTVYHLFIQTQEGIRANNIEEHREAITAHYRQFFNGTNIAQFNNSINALCNYLDGSMQEKISRINSKLISTVGPMLAEHYIIKKDPKDDKYKISIDRKLISYKD